MYAKDRYLIDWYLTRKATCYFQRCEHCLPYLTSSRVIEAKVEIVMKVNIRVAVLTLGDP